MGLFGDMFKRMKDPVRGQAQVVSCSMCPDHSTYSNCSMQLVVSAQGVPATSLSKTDMVRADRWPSPGMTLPVTVDRSNPKRVKVEWGEVESSRDRAEHDADALAAMMRGEPTANAMPFAAGGVDVVNLSGGDLTDLPEEKKAKLRMLGIDPSLLAAQQGGGPPMPPPQEAVADSDDEVDEQLARLAKLGKLRDAGVLTPAEFDAQKRRILEDG
jgi:hypothetical protein